MNKRTVLVSIVIAVMFACSGITAAAVVKESGNTHHEEERQWEHNQWKNLTLVENIYPDYQSNDARNNFYGYVWNDVFTDPSIRNAPDKDSALGALQSLDNYSSCIEDALDLIDRVFSGEASYEGHDADVMHRYYELNQDMGARNAIGFSCITDSVEEIWAIDSLDELSEFMKTGGYSLLTDVFVYEFVSNNYFNGGETAVYLYPSYSGMSLNFYYSESNLEKQLDLLYLMMTDPEIEGCLGIDDDTALELALDLYDFTVNYDYELYNNESVDVELDAADIAEQGFPFSSDLKIYIDRGCDSFIIDSGVLEVMNGIWDGANLGIFKTMLLCRLFYQGATHLNDTAYDYYGSVYETGDDNAECTLYCDTMVNYGCAALLAAQFYSKEMDKTYPTLKAEIYELAESIISEEKRYLTGLDWLSEESKKNIADKCDAVTIYSLYPDSWDPWNYDYIGDPYGEDCFYDYYVKMKHVVQEALASDSVKEPGTYWGVSLLLPQSYNACSVPIDNSIMLCYLWVAENYLDTTEGLLARNGVVIAHEFSHLFDSNGLKYDKDGNKNQIITESEAEVLTERMDRFVEYLDGFDLGARDDEGNEIFMNGSRVLNEYLADISGLSIILNIAEGIDDFDYREFFETYGLVFGKFISETDLSEMIRDVHPLSVYRINVNVQMFDEFYEAFGVAEGDGMYLPPDRRILVWA